MYQYRQVESKRIEKRYITHTGTKAKQEWLSEFQIKLTSKSGHCRLIKGSIRREDITVRSVCTKPSRCKVGEAKSGGKREEKWTDPQRCWWTSAAPLGDRQNSLKNVSEDTGGLGDASPASPNRHLENTLPNRSGVRILLKHSVSRTKREAADQERMFANPVSKKRLHREYMKNPQKPNSPKQISQLENGQKSQKDISPRRWQNRA